MRDKIGIIYAPLTAISPARWGWVDTTGQLRREKIRRELTVAAQAGANMIRLLPWGVWGYAREAETFSGFCLSDDGRYDLTRHRQEYYDGLRWIVQTANELGLTVWFDLFDRCGLGNHQNPWSNNVQQVDSFYQTPQLAESWIRAVVNALSGGEVVYGWGNELAGAAAVEFCMTTVAPTLRALGVPFANQAYGSDNPVATPAHRRLVGLRPSEVAEALGATASVHDQTAISGTALDHEAFRGVDVFYDGGTVVAVASDATFDQDWMKARIGDDVKLLPIRPVHGARSWPCAHTWGPLWWWGQNPIRKAICDDGVWDGDSTIDVSPAGQRRPSAETWYTIAAAALATRLEDPALPGLPLLYLEHSPKAEHVDGTAEGEAALVAMAATMRAISEAYHDRFGVWPENYRHPAAPQTPGHEPPPSPPTGPVRHCWKCSWWRRALCWFRIRPRRCRE